MKAPNDHTRVANVEGVAEFKNMVVSGDLRCEGEYHAHDPVCHAHRVPPNTDLTLTPAETNMVFYVTGRNEIRLPALQDLSPQAPLRYEIVGHTVERLLVHGPLGLNSYIAGSDLVQGNEQGIGAANAVSVRLLISTTLSAEGQVGWRVVGSAI